MTTETARTSQAALSEVDIDGVNKTILLRFDFAEALPLAPGSGPLAVLHFSCLPGGSTTQSILDTTIIGGVPLCARLTKVFNFVSIYPDYIPGVINIDIGTDNDRPATVLPHTFALAQNQPNPFNPTTAISFALPQTAHVRLTVYNILGQQVRALVDQSLPAGAHTITFDGRDASGHELASGIYLYKIAAGDFLQSRKMVLLK
jgi:hypothetical protein